MNEWVKIKCRLAGWLNARSRRFLWVGSKCLLQNSWALYLNTFFICRLSAFSFCCSSAIPKQSALLERLIIKHCQEKPWQLCRVLAYSAFTVSPSSVYFASTVVYFLKQKHPRSYSEIFHIVISQWGIQKIIRGRAEIRRRGKGVTAKLDVPSSEGKIRVRCLRSQHLAQVKCLIRGVTVNKYAGRKEEMAQLILELTLPLMSGSVSSLKSCS